MKFAIVSDTHDNLKNFGKAINFCNNEKITLILHCGDIASRETIEEARQIFQGEIKFVKGNCDCGSKGIPEKMEIKFGGKLIFFNHYPDIAKKEAESGKYDFVFYGHTHMPKFKKIGDCLLVNPGELAGQINKPSFAIYDAETGKLELKILEKI